MSAARLARCFALVVLILTLATPAIAAPRPLFEKLPVIGRLSGEIAAWLSGRPAASRRSIPPLRKCGGAVDPNGCPPVPPPCTVHCG